MGRERERVVTKEDKDKKACFEWKGPEKASWRLKGMGQ